MSRANQLTIRGFDVELEARLERVAQERGLSMNRAALLLMRRGAGLTEEGDEARTIGPSLDRFIGSWDAERERQVLEAVEHFESIDEKLWR